jgi:hypothetical protein
MSTRQPFSNITHQHLTDSSVEQSPKYASKKITRRRRRRQRQVIQSESSDSDDIDDTEENYFLQQQRVQVKTPLEKQQKKKKNRTKNRRQPRGADIFSPVKRPELPASDMSPGMMIRLAVCKKDLDSLKNMLIMNPSLVHDTSEVGENGAIEAGLTVLHVACQLGLDCCVELILKLSPTVDVNVQTESGSTALHYACSQGHATCVDLLICAGAKIHLKDILNQTPKEVAENSLMGDWDTCVELIEEEKTRIGFKALQIFSTVAVVTGLCYGLYYYLTTADNTHSSTDDSNEKNE